MISKVTAEGAVLEFARQQKEEPLRFDFPELELLEVAKDKRIDFRITAHQPIPRGVVRTTGRFGPWNADRTALSGSFEFTEADLGGIRGVDGRLVSNGSFTGALGRIEVRGRAEARDFQVSRSPNRVRLLTAYYCIVNGLNGDVFLEDVEAAFLRTTLRVHGRVSAEPGQRGKVATLHFKSDDARIENLLHLFTSAPRPALAGPIVLEADVVAPPGKEPFLKKLRLDGTFRIHDAQFTAGATQNKVNELSTLARGKEASEEERKYPGRVLSEMRGSVVLRGGVAKLSDISFQVPGAIATGAGTYNVITKQVAIRGAVSLNAKLSETTKGIKSILLKPIERFLDKNRSGGSIVPVSLTGTNSRPSFKLHLTKERQ